MKNEFHICGAPESATIRTAGAAQELRRVALVCPDQVVVELVKAVREEHRQATEPDRALVRDVKDRGGVCYPVGMTAEEWRNRLPNTLRGKRGRCVPADELAQEWADRGMIADPTSDAALDHLNVTYTRVHSKVSLPGPMELKKEARRIVRQRVVRAIRDIVHEARRECSIPGKSPEA